MKLTGLRHIARRLTYGLAAVTAAAAAMTMAMTSCRGDAPDAPVGEDQSGVVAFRVVAFKTAGSKIASRATADGKPDWGDDYPALGGDEFETAILRDQLYVMITDAACSQQYAVTNLVLTKTSDNALYVTYEYQGRVNDDDLEAVKALQGNAKLHVVANAGYRPKLSAETDFSLYGQPDNNFTAIPMWGVKTFDASAIGPDAPLNAGDVALLRSMAKVVIENLSGEGVDNYIKALKSVTVSAVNTRGYLLPDGWTGIADTKALDRHAARVPEQQAIPLTYNFTDNAVEFYLPEILNPADNEIKMDLTFETQGAPEGGRPKLELTKSWSRIDDNWALGDWDGNAPNWDRPSAIKNGACPRIATAWNGKLYTVNMRTMSIMEIDKNGARDVYRLPSLAGRQIGGVADYYGTAITHDEVGNFLIGHYFTKPTSSYVWTVYSPATGKAKHFTLSYPAGYTPTRIDCVGRVEGDLTHKAVVHIAPSGSNAKVLNITFEGGNGDVDNISATCTATAIEAPKTSIFTAICQPIGSGDYVYYSHSVGQTGLYTVSGNDATLNTKVLGMGNYAGTGGFETFTIDGKRYYVVNYLANPDNRNSLPMDIAVIDEDGEIHATWRNPDYKSTLGYSSIAVQQVDDSNVDIYVYNFTTSLNGNNKCALAAAKFRLSGNERTGTLYFRPYVNGDLDTTVSPYNLLRNYLYDYTVRMTKDSDVIYPVVDVTPYTPVELDPIFGLNPKDEDQQ